VSKPPPNASGPKGEEILEWLSPPADRRLSYGELHQQFADLRLPDGRGPHPLLVVLHGGFWRAHYDLDHMAHISAALARRGIATLNAEYRRVGDIGGGWPGTFEDVATVIAFANRLHQKYPVYNARVGVLGFSAGGHLALWAASSHRLPSNDPFVTLRPSVSYVVSLAGVTDLQAAWDEQLGNTAVGELLGGTPSDVPERYAGSPHALASWQPRSGMPGIDVVIAHGRADQTVPFRHAESYADFAARRGDRVTLLALDDVDHFDLIDPRSEACEAAVKVVLKVAEKNAPAQNRCTG
jgi:acetyl esterase/lipase